VGGTRRRVDLPVTVAIPPSAVERLVAGIAAEVDHDPVDATLTWTDGAAVATDHRTGLAVDRARAVSRVTAVLLAEDDASLALPTTVLEPARSTTDVGIAADTVAASIAATLDRRVTLGFEDDRWAVTPRELGATIDGPALVTAALAAGAPSRTLPTVLSVPDGALERFIADVAGSIDIAGRSATGAWSGGRLTIEPERLGRALERDAAVGHLDAALRGGGELVELTTRTTTPQLTRASFDRFLLVDQSARRVELRQGDTVVRSWPVAVGTGGSPTPTGTFVVGAKRFEPTWVNPAPDRWGRDMPARIGPGPDNPLGLRALNWNRRGAATR
jgi:hypothetical protein